MNIQKNKFKYYHIITFLLILSFVLSFFITYFSFGNEDSTIDTPININNIAPYLKFISSSKNNSLINLAIHNFILSVIAYILSVLTFGISSIFSLSSAGIIFAVTMKSSSSISTAMFVSLEALGMTLASFYGTYISCKRRLLLISIEKILIRSLIIVPILFIIYILSAYIESGLIYGLQ